MNGFSTFISNGKSPEIQEMESTWDASYLSFSWGGYSPLNDTVLVSLNFNSSLERNYSTSLSDVTSLFSLSGRKDWADRLTSLYPLMDRTPSPNVDLFCLYGKGLPTSYSYGFSSDSILGSAPVIVRNGDGDDNQDLTDNEFCKVWSSQLGEKEHRFESVAFSGVAHMQMVTDEKVMEKIHSILVQY